MPDTSPEIILTEDAIYFEDGTVLSIVDTSVPVIPWFVFPDDED